MWGLECWVGWRFLVLARRAGLPALDAYGFEGGSIVLRWVHGVCLGALALVARLCWRVSRWCEGVDEAVLDGADGSWVVGPCAILSRRVLFLSGCLVWVLFAFGYDMQVGGLSA